MEKKSNVYDRREFISFLGKASVGLTIIPPFLAGCGNNTTPLKKVKNDENYFNRLKKIEVIGIEPTDKDDLLLAQGLSYHVVLSWGEKINEKDTFGFNNDFNCFIPISDDNPNDGLLWVNHEYVNPLFVSGFNRNEFKNPNEHRTVDQVNKEMYNVGGSIVRIQKVNGKWKPILNDPRNRRITGHTKIKFNWDEPIYGAKEAIGTNSNCSGGITPWNTFLTCEENYDSFFGEREFDVQNVASKRMSSMGWDLFYDFPPEHYGWVVEVNPQNGEALKHVALGRFAHECCTLFELQDKRIVAYSGDDKNDEHLYKFISSKPGSLKEGTLYVADTINGIWIPMVWETQSKLQERFTSQTEVLIRAREAAKILGATPLNRPEDIEIDPITGHIFVSLTNNKAKGDFHGSILKIEEDKGAYDALSFKASTYKAGGEVNGFSCPDNLAFDLAGNLWITSDISGTSMNHSEKPYNSFKNNGLFVIPRYGEREGEVIQVASAPTDAELTGPWFAPDGKTLFLSVQHPGELSESIEKTTSKWPFDADGIPKPSVVAITGELLEKLTYYNYLK